METLIATAFAALFAGCWVMEMRSSRKMREGHLDYLHRRQKVHADELRTARNSGWLEGVDYQREQMTRKRDKAGRFA